MTFLGAGSYANVSKVVHKTTGVIRAMKTLDKKNVESSLRDANEV